VRDRPALRPHAAPAPPDVAARASLRYIRETMARTAAFTAVPGWGGVLMGTTALVAAALAAQQETALAWLRVWGTEALVGFALGLATTWRKAQAGGVPMLSGAGRKFLLGLFPALATGVVLTLAVYGFDAGAVQDAAVPRVPVEASATGQLLPGLWLLVYGAGVVAAGAFSVRPVPLMGAALMATGALALLAPAAWGDAFLAFGFGGLQMAFGVWIARSHGG